MHVVVFEQELVAAGLGLLPLTYDSWKVLKFLYQPMLLHLYIKLGSCPPRSIHPDGQLPTTQIFGRCMLLLGAPDDACDGGNSKYM